MGDSYRPSRSDHHRPPPLADRMTFTHGGDSYRPGDRSGPPASQAQFTFQSQHQGPRFPPTGPAADSGGRRQRNRGALSQGTSHRGPGRADNTNNSSRNNRGNQNGGPRRGAYRKTAPSERALLQHRDGGHEQTLGVAEGSNRFLNLDDLSDEAGADSDSNGEGDRVHKVAKTQVPNLADGDSVPQWANPPPAPVAKWSNPDPYTALPPPSETTGVKMDVVQLIRKAKNQEAIKAAGNNAVAANDDFISFGEDDDEQENTVDQDDAHELRTSQDDDNVVRDQSNGSRRPASGSMNDTFSRNDINDVHYQPNGRTRKRKHEPEGFLVPEWVPRPRSDATPWVRDPKEYYRLAKQPYKWLHNEILDFHEFVAPQSFEHQVRHTLVERVSTALSSRRWFTQDSGRILCFGSYPAGLYLPTGDMDLVYASDSHYKGGPPLLVSTTNQNPFKRMLYKAARRLEDSHVAAGRVTVIGNAKVPILKFQDRLTGLAVDISFENLSGVQAQATFQEWKEQYPDMVYLVPLVKQFLVMRGLNEVHTGGLGGFSVICLIVNYLHHAPQATNLGDRFMGFLEFYGKKFDMATQRLQMHPIEIVNKTTYGIDGRPEKPDGLSIQDPNKPENNISGGSRRAADAFRAFAAAHDTLADRIKSLQAGLDIGESLLGCIFAGNYDAYITQRRHLRTLGHRRAPMLDHGELAARVESRQMMNDEWTGVCEYLYYLQIEVIQID